MTNPNALLQQADHRPWPLPASPWVMTQVWHDLLFAHWPVPLTALRPVIPPALEVDTYDNQAWLGVVPFGMDRVYPRRAFAVPWLSRFLELNVRTYVRVGDRPGVYFFSLDAANPVAVEVARRWFQLPYYHAHMSLLQHRHERRAYHSYRTHPGAAPAEFKGVYRPTGAVFQARPASLEAWLTERYCLYTVDRRGRVFRGEIHHPPWPLQPAEAEIEINTMALPHGLRLPNDGRRPALAHFARRIETVEWPITRLRPQ